MRRRRLIGCEFLWCVETEHTLPIWRVIVDGTQDALTASQNLWDGRCELMLCGDRAKVIERATYPYAKCRQRRPRWLRGQNVMRTSCSRGFWE